MHPGVAARTRREHERGGNLFLREKKERKKKEITKHAATDEEWPSNRGRWILR